MATTAVNMGARMSLEDIAVVVHKAMFSTISGTSALMRMNVRASPAAVLPPATTLWEASSAYVRLDLILTNLLEGARMLMNVHREQALVAMVVPTPMVATNVDALEDTSELAKGIACLA